MAKGGLAVIEQPPPFRPNTHQVVRLILAHAEPLLPREYFFSPSDLHAAMEKLKACLPEEAAELGVLSDLVFSEPTVNPHSELLDSIKSAMWAARVGLIELCPGGRRERERCRLNPSWATRLRNRSRARWSYDEIALIGMLVPLFAECLKEVVASRGKP